MALQIKKHNKAKVIDLLRQTNKIVKISEQINNTTEPEQYDDSRAWWFLDYNDIQDIISFEIIGMKHMDLYHMFKGCLYDPEDKPVAWYKSEFSYKGDGSIKGPSGFSTYIPDCISDLLLYYKHSTISAPKKYDLLIRMYKDLVKLQRKHFKESRNV